MFLRKEFNESPRQLNSEAFVFTLLLAKDLNSLRCKVLISCQCLASSSRVKNLSVLVINPCFSAVSDHIRLKCGADVCF